jgi:hypothetical protein
MGAQTSIVFSPPLVYETSALYALQASNHAQFVSSISVLVPSLYLAESSTTPPEEALSKLSLGDVHTTSETHTRTDRRSHFASLMLLYQICYLADPGQFLAFYDDWTTTRKFGRRKDMRRHAGEDGSSTDSFVEARSPHIRLAFSAYRALRQTSPIAYRRCRSQATVTTHQRIVLDWGAIKLRETMWKIMRKAYLSCTIGFAGRLLLLRDVDDEETIDEWEDPSVGKVKQWCIDRGARVDGGVIHMK